MFDESKRQRAMRLEVGVSRQASGIVKPINERIAAWQSSAALLTALNRRLHRSGTQSHVRQEVETLASLVRAERQALAACARDLPSPLAASSRILDTKRALANLEATLGAMLAQDGGRHSMDDPHPLQSGRDAER
jgi:hypothetical protein